MQRGNNVDGGIQVEPKKDGAGSMRCWCCRTCDFVFCCAVYKFIYLLTYDTSQFFTELHNTKSSNSFSLHSPTKMIVPMQCVNVHQHGTTGVSHISDVLATIRSSSQVLHNSKQYRYSSIPNTTYCSGFNFTHSYCMLQLHVQTDMDAKVR